MSFPSYDWTDKRALLPRILVVYYKLYYIRTHSIRGKITLVWNRGVKGDRKRCEPWKSMILVPFSRSQQQGHSRHCPFQQSAWPPWEQSNQWSSYCWHCKLESPWYRLRTTLADHKLNLLKITVLKEITFKGSRKVKYSVMQHNNHRLFKIASFGVCGWDCNMHQMMNCGESRSFLRFVEPEIFYFIVTRHTRCLRLSGRIP